MQRKLLVCLRWAFSLALLGFAGCVGPSALRNEYLDYSQCYANQNDNQLLLNLARMANHDPVNFIQLGSFSSSYQVGGNIGFNANNVNNRPGYYPSSKSTTTGGGTPSAASSVASSVGEYTANALTLGGSAGASFTETPTFQYLPITGTNLSALVMNPITDKVFLTLYDQGFRADLLARTMLAAWMFELQSSNSATGEIATNYLSFVNNPNDPSYPAFLNLCDYLRYMQLSEKLVVGSKNQKSQLVYFGQAGTDATLKDVATAIQSNLSVKCEPTFPKEGIDDPNYTSAKHWISVNTQAKSEMAFVFNRPQLTSSPGTSAIFLGPAGYMDALKSLNNIDFTNLAVIKMNSENSDNHSPSRMEVANIDQQADSLEPLFKERTPLKMRTVESAMYGAANEENWYRTQARNTHCDIKCLLSIPNISQIQESLSAMVAGGTIRDHLEQKGLLDVGLNQTLTNTSNIFNNFGIFDGLMTLYKISETNMDEAKFLLGFTKDIAYGTDVDGPYAIVVRKNNYPLMVRPLLKMTRQKNENPFDHVLAEVQYEDPKPGGRHAWAQYYVSGGQSYYVGDRGDANWNRSVFTVLSYLFSQAAINTQNLPVQQLLQIQ